MSTGTENKGRERQWNGFQTSLLQDKSLSMNDTMKDWIILDCGSSTSLFANPNLVKNIEDSSNMLELSTNAGIKYCHQKAEVPGFGKVWFDQDAVANIFGLVDLRKRYKVLYDSEKEDAFIVHLKDRKKLKFKASPGGLYFYKVSPEYKEYLQEMKEKEKHKTSYLMSSMAENKQGFSQ